MEEEKVRPERVDATLVDDDPIRRRRILRKDPPDQEWLNAIDQRRQRNRFSRAPVSITGFGITGFGLL